MIVNRCMFLSLIAMHLSVSSCRRDSPPENSERLHVLATAADNFDEQLTTVEAEVAQLSSDFDELRSAFADVAARYRLAQEARRAAGTMTTEAEARSQQASKDFQTAASNLRFARMVIAAAIRLDRARMARSRGAARATSADDRCEGGMSTQRYRDQLRAQGVNVDGTDVDHIVPRSLGGADHPLNYELLPSSVNRSLGAKWDIEKCTMAGEDRCADAIAISAECGSYAGGLPETQ